MSNAPKPADDTSPGRGTTPVPPRGGKNRGGNRSAGRPGTSRPGSSSAKAPSGRQARQAAQRRNRVYAVIAVVAVVAIVAVMVIVSLSSGSSSKPRQPAPAAAVTQMQNVPVSTLVAGADKVGQGNLNYATTAAGGPLTANGKPEVLFVGAEFCPVCAAERWPMTLALMKFGTFTNLQQTHSAKADGDAGTWSYYGSTYNSKYLSFNPQELYTNEPSGGYYKPLDKITPQAQQNWTANEGSNLTFPFINFAGKETLQTAQYNPQLIYYHDFNYVLGAVGDNNSSVGAQIDASAAVFTKYLCGITNNQPSDVCSAVAKVSAPVTANTNSGQTTPAG